MLFKQNELSDIHAHFYIINELFEILVKCFFLDPTLVAGDVSASPPWWPAETRDGTRDSEPIWCVYFVDSSILSWCWVYC